MSTHSSEVPMSIPEARIAPVRRSVEVSWPVDEAFRRFTAGIANWWPLRTHSVGQEHARTVVFDDHVGGRIYEIVDDGETHTWGTILSWDPPGSVRFTWHPSRAPESAQEVEVRFVGTTAGTRLELTHSGWETLGRDGRRARFGYNLGWIPVLDRWAGRTSVAGATLNAAGAIAMAVSRLRPRRRSTPG